MFCGFTNAFYLGYKSVLSLAVCRRGWGKLTSLPDLHVCRGALVEADESSGVIGPKWARAPSSRASAGRAVEQAATVSAEAIATRRE